MWANKRGAEPGIRGLPKVTVGGVTCSVVAIRDMRDITDSKLRLVTADVPGAQQLASHGRLSPAPVTSL